MVVLRTLSRAALGGCLLLAVGCSGRSLPDGARFDAGDSGARDVPPADARDGSPGKIRDGSPADVRDGSRADVRDGSRADVRDGSRADVPDASPGTIVVCTDLSRTDCTSAPGCETTLGTDTDCAGCGDRSCAIANTMFSCSSANGCTSAVCAVGFANCDRSSPDCESVAAAGASCLPTYGGSVAIGTSSNAGAAAIATDGSFFLGGTFRATVSFGTPAAPDVRMPAAPGNVDGFITKFNADGSYAWTGTFPATAGVDLYGHATFMAINALAATADGGVVAVGSYPGTIDLDPGAAVLSYQTTMRQWQQAFVVKLAADGSFAWGGTFESQSFDSESNAAAVAIDGAGAVYVAAWYAGEVDLDPSAGTEVHTSRLPEGAAVTGALVKLTPAGKLSWVQSADTGAYVPSPASITLATDESIWVLGDTAAGGTASASGGDFIASYRPDGASRGYWGFGGPSALLWPYSIASGQGGSVYIAGGGAGVADFDPGPGVAHQFVGVSNMGGVTTGGFILKLGSDGSYLWAQMFPGGEVHAVTSAPDGGVIGLGQFGVIGKQSDVFVAKLNADGSAGWTFSSGAIPGTVASSGTRFVVTGSTSNWSSDMDPGPGVDIVGGGLYLSRFNF